MIAVFPFELIIGGANAASSGGVDTKNLRLIAFVKAPRLLRLSKVLRYLDRLGNATLIKIARLFLIFCFITHLAACGFNLLQVSQEAGAAGKTWFKSQVVRAGLLCRRCCRACPPPAASASTQGGVPSH